MPVPSPWHTVPGSRFEALSGALIPEHVAIQSALDAIVQGIVQLGQGGQEAALGARDVDFTRVHRAVEAMTEAEQSLLADMAVGHAALASGLAVLDGFAPEPCFADWWATERVAMLALGDAIDLLPIPGSASAFVPAWNAGVWLFRDQADAEHEAARGACITQSTPAA